MREIKFRQWYRNEMHIFGFVDDGEKYNSFISPIHCCNKKYPVMQFTGLQDKNGTDIYEGDIVMAGNELFVVKFWMGNSCLCSSGHETGMPIYPYNVNNRIEVVDNIHQNPELV